ncbi:MAG: glycosyltransferase family 4 protein [Nitriliruptoraceae bacterium]
MSLEVLWITNDLPPRTGGIQQFVANLVRRVHPATSVVLGPAAGPEAREADRGEPYRTVRLRGAVVPGRRLRRAVADIAQVRPPEVVVLGASWPLGEEAGWLRDTLGVPVVALSHGLEAGMAGVGLSRLLTRATRDLAAVTTISRFTAARLAEAVAAERIRPLPPGVDIHRFRPDVDGARLRRELRLPPDALVVGCISRLVPRKGQDQLLAVWPEVQRRHPAAWLLLVGEGPSEGRLRRRAEALGPGAQVRLAGAVPWARLPEAYAASDVFAMPCRTRWGGLDVEGLGIVYLEALASGRPIIAGRSGGAPETVLDPAVGSVVDGRDRPALVAALDRWLGDAAARREAGRIGRRLAVAEAGWDAIAAEMVALLDEVVAADGAVTGPGGAPPR